MTSRPTDAGHNLRQLAEIKVRKEVDSTLEQFSPEQLKQALHDLRVNQVELEMQNEELLALQHELEASQSSYYNMYELAPLGYLTLNIQGIIQKANLTAATLLGIDRNELVKRPMTQFIFSEDQDIFYICLRRLLEENEVMEWEMRMVHSDRSPTWMHLQAAKKAEDAFFLTFSDITRLKVTENILSESEQKYRLLFESAGDNISIMTLQGKLLAVNPTACKMLGYTYDELITLTADKIDIKPELLSENIGKLTTYGHYSGETEFVRKDGSTVPVTVDARRIVWDGQPAILSICRDITEQKQNLHTLDYVNKCFSQALNGSRHILYRLNVKTGYDYLSPAFEEITGHPLAEFKRVNLERLAEYFHPDDIPHVLTIIDEACRSRKGPEVTMSFEYRLKKADGAYCWLFDSTTACFNENDELEYYFGSAYDITERKQSEALQRETSEKFSVAFNCSPIMMSISTIEDGIYLDVNQSFLDISEFSREEIIGNTSVKLGWLSESDRNKIKDIILQYGKASDVDLTLKSKSGKEILCKYWVEYITVAGQKQLLSLGLDITEQRMIEQQYYEAQRLESLGIMAGGIAHDFNNLLQSMFGNLDLATLELDPGSGPNKYISYAMKSAKQAAHLTDLMLSYVGKGFVVKKNLNLNDLVRDNTEMLKAAASSTVPIDISLSAELPFIFAGEAEIQQVIMNLITNAAESINDQSGHIRIATGIKNCDQNFLSAGLLNVKLKPGPYVYLKVTDTGCGMSKDTLSHLFDPFFTTKFTGRGLGMSAVMGIIKSHDGTLFVESKLGKGTTFKVLFPALEKPAATTITEGPVALTAENHASRENTLSGVLLLVDDEKYVIKTCTKMAELIGFKVITARDGIDAVDKYRNHQDEIDVVLMDLTMPKMDGITAMNEIYKIKPDAKIILASGYNEDELSKRIFSKPPSGFIRKPYSMGTLKAELQK